MPLKYALPLLFIGALVLASTTGCTTNTGNQASEVSTAYPTAGKSELLQGIVAEENESVGSRWDGYKVTWINNTAVNIQGKTTSYGGSLIQTHNYTYMHFPTVNSASAYFDSKRPQYTEKSSSANHGSLYSLVTDHDATVIKSVWRSGTIGSDDVIYRLEQLDALVIDDSYQSHWINQA